MVNWQDDEVVKLKYEFVFFEVFEEYFEWEVKGREEFVKKGVVFIFIVLLNLDLLKGVDFKWIVVF